MKPHTAPTLVLTLCLLIFSGCAGLGNKVDKQSLDRMKTAALIGLTFDEREPVTGEGIAKDFLGLTSQDEGIAGGGRTSFEIKNEKHADAAYDIAAKVLADKLHLKFIPRAKVVQDAGVKSLFEKKNATIQTGVTPLKPYYERFEAQNVPQFYNIHWADKSALNEIARRLQVDTLIIINTKVDLSAGIFSKMSSTANINLMFYDPAVSDFATYVNEKGEAIDTKDSKIMGFADTNEMHIQSLEAMKSALDTVVKKL